MATKAIRWALMKVIGPILTVASLALGGAGYAYWWSLPVVDASMPAWTAIEAARTEFAKTRTPVATLRKELFTDQHHRALIDPAMALPRSHQFPFASISALKHYADTCDAAKYPKPSADDALAKAWRWHAFLCKAVPELPRNFFMEPPFMHPMGRSFVVLALASKRPEFADPYWGFSHKHLLHALEFSSNRMERLFGNNEEAVLAHAPAKALAGIVAMEETILAGGYVLLLDRESERTGPAGYRVFTALDWEAFSERLPFELTVRQSGTPCLQGQEHFCWIKRPAEPRRMTMIYGGLALCALLVLCGTLVYLIVRRVIAERRDRQEQIYALQTLTHELRTPATSLNLTLEALRRDYDALPGGSQSAFLRLCDEVQRLNRVIAGSVRYLKVSGASARNRYERKSVESINGYVDTTLTAYRERIVIEPLEQDRSLIVDAHWLGICLTNLVENALTHGRPPVLVRVKADAKYVTFSVQDQGQLAANEFGSLSRAFARGSASKGLGLGLHIVKRTMKGLGGTLQLAKEKTTTFVLTLPVTR